MVVNLLDPIDFIETRRQYGIWEDFVIEAPRQTAEYDLADLDANANLADTFILATPRAIYIHDVGITPDGSATGVDNSNTSAWDMTSDGSTSLLAKTFKADVAYPADGVYQSMITGGTLTTRYLAASGHLELSVVNGTTANLVASVVTISYSDAENYPVAGFGVLCADGGSAVIVDGVKGVCRLTTGATRRRRRTTSSPPSVVSSWRFSGTRLHWSGTSLAAMLTISRAIDISMLSLALTVFLRSAASRSLMWRRSSRR